MEIWFYSYVQVSARHFVDFESSSHQPAPVEVIFTGTGFRLNVDCPARVWFGCIVAQGLVVDEVKNIEFSEIGRQGTAHREIDLAECFFEKLAYPRLTVVQCVFDPPFHSC